jgi:hypothetical protein
MLPESRMRLSLSDVESSRLKLSMEEAISPLAPEEQLTEIAKAGTANVHTTMKHASVNISGLLIIGTPSRSG